MKKKRPKKKQLTAKVIPSAKTTDNSETENLSSPVCYAQSPEIRDEYKTDSKT